MHNPDRPPPVRVAFVTDLHLGAAPGGWAQQLRWTGAPAGFPFGELRGWLAEHRVAQLIVGGDLTDHATPDEISAAVATLDALALPILAVLGNHEPEAYVKPIMERLDRHPRARLVLSGHCHAQCATWHGERLHLSASALNESPFELRLIELHPGEARITTHRLPVPDAAPGPDPAKTWALGHPGDRTATVKSHPPDPPAQIRREAVDGPMRSRHSRGDVPSSSASPGSPGAPPR